MYHYEARVVRVVDGDTIELDVDLGFHVRMRESFRVLGINAPESRGAERDLGKVCTDVVKTLMPEGCLVEVMTRKAGKFGRWLAQIRLPDGTDLAGFLVDNGYARIYRGDGPMPRFDPEEAYPLEREGASHERGV